MEFDVIHRVSAMELGICLTAKLVIITVGMGDFYRLCYQRMREATGRDLSLLKFTRYMAKMPQRLVNIHVWLMEGAPASSPTCVALRKHCCYDQRKRLNYHQKQRALRLTWRTCPKGASPRLGNLGLHDGTPFGADAVLWD